MPGSLKLDPYYFRFFTRVPHSRLGGIQGLASSPQSWFLGEGLKVKRSVTLKHALMLKFTRFLNPKP